MKSTLRLLLLIVISGLLGCARHPRHVNLPSSGGAYDEDFLRWLVRYHEDQDRMTRPCAENNTIRQELRNFCAQNDRQHNERIERMRSWLKGWYNRELPKPDPYPLWLGSLKGEEFEREFFKEYLAQHDEGIEQTAKCASKAAHPELRELCGRVNPMQKKTDAQLKAWRCQWFKECD